MQNNLRNRSVALASAFALALTGIVATAPAAQAVSPVGLSPSSGVNTGAFITDQFSMDIETPQGLSASRTAIRIDNPKSEHLQLSFPAAASNATFRGFDSRGVEYVLTQAADRISSETAVVTRTETVATDASGMSAFFEESSGSSAPGRSDDEDITIDFTGFTTLIVHGLNSSYIDDQTDPILDRDFSIGVRILEVADTDATDRLFDYGDGNQGDVTIQAWNEIEADPDYSTVDSATASEPATIKWYDPATVSVIPSVERFQADAGFVLNDTRTNAQLGAKLRFTQPALNLDQIAYDKFTIQGTTSATGRTGDAKDLETTVPTGRSSQDDAGALYVILQDDTGSAVANDGIIYEGLGADLTTTKSYGVRVKHDDAPTGIAFQSVLFTPPANGQNIDRETFVTVTDSANAEQENTEPSANGTDINLRPGVNSFTYKARVYSDDAARDKTASVAVLATVKADYIAPGETLSVSGTNQTIGKVNEGVVTTGLTDSNGEYFVTVTSSDASALTQYTVKFFTLDDKVNNAGEWQSDKDNGGTTAAEYTATYGATAVDRVVATNDTLSGSTVTAEVTVVDAYGEGISSSSGSALYATFRASDSDVLSETVAVDADGKASTTFANYLDEGGSDLMSVFVHTGASYDSNNQKATTVISLYNPADVEGVNAPETYTGVITYDDFITGAASSTNIAPDDDNRISTTPLSGTVVDADGSGVPGAVVTVDAPGMQLRKSDSGDYFQDSITFAADAAGGFKVDMWSHTLSPAGVDVTITSGGQSATTEVKTYLPSGLDGKNLVFDINPTPEVVEVNRTYALTLSLSDKWGNPIATSGTTVRVQGTGSVTINSETSDTSTPKSFRADGTAVVFMRSIKDIEGPGNVSAQLENAQYTSWDGSLVTNQALNVDEETTDVSSTEWDETVFENLIGFNVNVGDAVASSDQKVNAGSFKGYVALYAKGYEGQRMSAIVAGKWLQVDSLASNFERVVRFTGAGYDIKVRIYIDGEQVGPEFDILTK